MGAGKSIPRQIGEKSRQRALFWAKKRCEVMITPDCYIRFHGAKCCRAWCTAPLHGFLTYPTLELSCGGQRPRDSKKGLRTEMAARDRKTRLAALEKTSPSPATLPDLQAQSRNSRSKDPMSEIGCLRELPLSRDVSDSHVPDFQRPTSF